MIAPESLRSSPAMRPALITAILISVASVAAVGPAGVACAKPSKLQTASRNKDQDPSPAGSAQSLGVLLHATPDRVRTRLGEPSIARAEGKGALWTYEGSRCALFIFFRDEGGLHVSGAAAGPRRHGVSPPDLDVCLADLQRSDVAGRTP